MRGLTGVFVVAACSPPEHAVPDATSYDDPVIDPVRDPAWPADEPIPAAFDFPPYANLVDARTVAISWRSVDVTTGVVRFGRAGDPAVAVSTAAASNLHHVALADLEPGAAYHYEVAIDGTDARRRGMFVVPGPSRTQWRMMHSGELHAPSESANVQRFASAVRAFRPHVVVESGDMVDDGDDLAHWRSYFRTTAPWISNVLLLPSHSNHVNGPDGNAHLLDLFVLPNNERWYATRYGQAEIVTVDSTYEADGDIVAEQLPWLEETTRAAHDGLDDPTFVIASWHYPACSSYYRSRSGLRDWVHDNLLGRLQAGGGVDLVLAGHDKYYERSVVAMGGQTVTHVMTNIGQVSPEIPGNNHPACTTMMTARDRQSMALIQIDGTTLTGRIVDENGDEVDRFEIAK